MNDDGIDFFALFLALSDARLNEARTALAVDDEKKPVDSPRAAGSLIPLAVDAALLGAEGVSSLAVAIVKSAQRASRAEIARALATLAEAVAALGHGDASGARTNESALVETAAKLEALAPGARIEARPEVSPHAPEPSKADDTIWSPSLPEELIGPFLDECHERIEGLSARILKLEEEGAQAGGGEEVRALFRDLHTLKGSSGFAGLARLNRLAHAAEDLVAKVRDGAAACDRPVIDVLLAAIDRFRAIVERASTRAPIDVEVDDLVERFRNPAARAAPPKAAAVKEQAPKAASAAATAGGGTLRVEFERVDQLQNFVNELVLARGRLSSATTGQLSLSREMARIRRTVHEIVVSGEGTAEGAGKGNALRSVVDEISRAERVVDEGAAELESSLGTLAMALSQLRDRVMKLRMVPIARLFTKHQRTVRELGQQLGKKVKLELMGEGTELDKVLVEQLEDPLIHLVRNAIDHGVEMPSVRTSSGKPEQGTLSLRARQQGGAIVIEVADDGGGIDPAKMRKKGVEKGLLTAEEAAALTDREALEIIFRAGFSTAEQLTDVSGRGVGMDVVRESIARLKGTIEIRSEIARGTTFELRLPLTLAVAQVLLARVGGEEVALPIDAVAHTLAIDHAENHAGGENPGAVIEDVGGRPCLLERPLTTHPLDDDQAGAQPARHVPVVDLAATLGLEAHHGDAARRVGSGGGHGGHLIILEAPLTDVPRVALGCDGLLGRHEVVVKPLGPLLSAAPCVAGASLIGDRVVLLLDVASVVRRGLEVGAGRLVQKARPHDEQPAKKRLRILVAEDADVIREALRQALERAGYSVVAARDGAEALERAQAETFDLVSTDVMMPRLDGYGLTRALRALPAYAKVPIVMVTSRDQRVDVLRGYDAGVDAYVTKPADVTALLRTIDDLLPKKN